VQLNKPSPTRPGLDLASAMREKIASRDEAMRQEYMDASKSASDPITRRKRLIWRSKQRGWLEVDLLMGSWASDHCMQLSDEQVVQYERLLELETIDIFAIVSGQAEAPDDIKSPLLDDIKRYAQSFPLGRADPLAYARIKTKMAN